MSTLDRSSFQPGFGVPWAFPPVAGKIQKNNGWNRWKTLW